MGLNIEISACLSIISFACSISISLVVLQQLCEMEEAAQYILYTHQIGISALLMSSVCALMRIFSCGKIQYSAMANIQRWQETYIQLKYIQRWRKFSCGKIHAIYNIPGEASPPRDVP